MLPLCPVQLLSVGVQFVTGAPVSLAPRPPQQPLNTFLPAFHMIAPNKYSLSQGCELVLETNSKANTHVTNTHVTSCKNPTTGKEIQWMCPSGVLDAMCVCMCVFVRETGTVRPSVLRL